MAYIEEKYKNIQLVKNSKKAVFRISHNDQA